MGEATPDWFDGLSDDGKVVLAAHFGMGSKTTLTFQTPWNIGKRALAALDELETAGVLSKSVGSEGLYAHTYRLARPAPGLFEWLGRNQDLGRGFSMTVGQDDRQERPPSGWPVPAGYKRHPR